jgi:GNAT superfamily N-acetyltransferase
MDPALVVAAPADAAAIAALHAESWRSAYRGLYPDAFIDGPVVDERLQFWTARMHEPDPDRRHVLKAVADGLLVGIACVLLDAEPSWGPLLDNLHVKPGFRGHGIGRRLLRASLEWAGTAAPGQPMHLWVMEGNTAARAFYDREGGVFVERKIVDVVPGFPQPILRYVWRRWQDGS